MHQSILWEVFLELKSIYIGSALLAIISMRYIKVRTSEFLNISVVLLSNL